MLHRCATSLSSIAGSVYRRIEGLDGFVGLLARLVAFLAGPLVKRLVQCWLFWFSFTDSVVLTMEMILLYFVPSLRPILEKIDEIAPVADSLPEKFERSMDELPSLVEKIPDQLVQCASVFRSFANVVVEPKRDGVKRKAERKKDEEDEEGEDDKGKRIIVEVDDESREGMSGADCLMKQSTILDLFEERWHAKPFAGKRR